MASTQEFQKINLSPDDVPGAYINIDDFESCSILQLKRWLECRGLKTTGNKPDLLQRCKDAIQAGKLEDIDVSVDQGKWHNIKEEKIKKERSSQSSWSSVHVPPVTGWNIFPSQTIPANFNYGHIYHYLLESVVLLDQDGKKEDTDLSHMTSKSLTKGEQYVKSDSISDIMDTCRNGNYYLKGKVAASMRNEFRNVHITISIISGAVLDASCTCPAAALGRCNHVAALLLMLNKHCMDNGYEPASCTSKPCEWNKGKKANKNPGKVTEVSYSFYKVKKGKISDFDPRPKTKRHLSKENKNNFVTELKYGGCKSGRITTCMWETLIKYRHENYEIDDAREGVLNHKRLTLFNNLKEERSKYDTDIYMISGTESQSESITWKANRWFRITASTAKQANTLGNLMLTNTDTTDAILRKLYNYISYNIWNINSFSTTDIQFGIDNEDQARNDYMKYKLTNGSNVGFKVLKTGFWVNKYWPELGCSPDGLVFDPSELNKYGLVEIKCLKLFRTLAPSDLFKKLTEKEVKPHELYNACFARPLSDNSTLELKTTHAYYYQIQFQLAITGLKWCDLVLWSPVGKPNVERIRRDDQLITNMMSNVTSLWIRVIAPEIFEMRVPRKLYPVILDL